MKKKIFALLCCTLILSSCGKVSKLKNGEDAVVSFNNGEKISIDDLYNKLRDTYALSTLITMVDTYVLEETFPSYVEKAHNYADSYVNAVKENYDTDEAFLDAIQEYTGLSTIEAYNEQMYLSYMQSHANKEYAKTQITDKEIEKYYKNEVVGDIEVSHILITPEVTDKMTDEEKKNAEEVAKNKAEEVLAKLKDVKKDALEETFSELAKEYSNDDDTKDKGGSLGKINKDTLSDNYDELVKAAYSIKDGEYYKKVITTELGYHIIIRTKSYDKPTLENKKADIISTLADELTKSDKNISVTSLQHYRKELGMNIEDDTLNKQYANYIQYQLSKSITEK